MGLSGSDDQQAAHVDVVRVQVAQPHDANVFVGPGHVSTVIGCRPYDWIAKDEGKPVVVSGFEPLDILQSVLMLLRQLRNGEAKVENQYKRVVPWEGNRAALKAMAEVFELRPYFEWRGLGFISQSALRIKPTYAQWDAEHRFSVPGVRVCPGAMALAD